VIVDGFDARNLGGQFRIDASVADWNTGTSGEETGG